MPAVNCSDVTSLPILGLCNQNMLDYTQCTYSVCYIEVIRYNKICQNVFYL